MPFQILINIFIAFLWMFFQDNWSILSFFSGYLVGLIIVFSLRRFFKQRFYLWTLFAVLKLLLVFTRELISSSVLVVKQIMRPKINVTPGIFKLETELETDIEITLISLLITLRRGSVVMDVSTNKVALFVNAMEIPE